MSLRESGTGGTHYHLQNTLLQKPEVSMSLKQLTLLYIAIYRSLYYMCLLLYHFLIDACGVSGMQCEGFAN